MLRGINQQQIFEEIEELSPAALTGKTSAVSSVPVTVLTATDNSWYYFYKRWLLYEKNMLTFIPYSFSDRL